MKISLWNWAVILIILSTLNAWGYSVDDCIRCHAQGGGQSKRYISLDEYGSSIHGREITCIDCHQGVRDNGHIESKGSGKVDCQQCHEQENLHSRDGKVKCFSCHTKHHIYSPDDHRSSVYWKNLKNTCANCHHHE